MKILGAALAAGRPSDPIDELAFALVHATRGSIDGYLSESKRWAGELAAAAEAGDCAATDVAMFDRQLAEAVEAAERADAEAAAANKRASVAMVVALAVAVAGAGGAMAGGGPVAFFAGFAVAVALHFAVQAPATKRRDNARRRGGEARAAHAEASGRRAQAAARREDARAAEAYARKHLALLKPVRAVDAIGHVFYPVAVARLGESAVIVDLGGATEATPVSLPDSRDAASAQAHNAAIAQALAAASRLPVLLDPGSGEASVDSLHGEERSLRGAVDTFADVVHGTRIQSALVPMVERGDPIASLAAQEWSRAREVETLRGVAVPVADNAKGALGALGRVDALKRSATAGHGVLTGMLHTCEQIEASLSTFQELRSEAVDLLNESIAEVIDRADLPHVHMFCPKCNQIPAWVFFTLGVERATAHLMGSTELLEAMQANPEVAERLADPEAQWPALLDRRLGELRLLEEHIAATEAEAGLISVAAGARASRFIAFEARLRAYKDQHARMVREFEGYLVRIATGFQNPRLVLSRQAVLRLNRATDTWHCAVCKGAFPEGEARFGRMLRVKSDLLMPMWNTLWTEKADFRRSEKFRTDEEVRQRVIDEQKDLLDPVNAYQADMRPVRENIIREAATAEEALEKLGSTALAMEAVGVISQSQRQGMLAGVAKAGAGGVDVARIKRDAEARESMLMAEPAAQAARRPTAVDPIDVVMSPDALFDAAPPTAGRGGVALATKGG